MKELNEKYKRFADYYIECLNIKEAALKCGFSEKTAAQQGSRVFNKVETQEYIKERLANKDSDRIASQDEILEYLTSVMRGNVTDQLGLETPVRERNKAAELLGKRHALFVDKTEISGELNIIKVIPPKIDED